MLAAPDKVPQRGDEEEGDENDRGVVHGCGVNWEVGWHAEEGNSQDGPG